MKKSIPDDKYIPDIYQKSIYSIDYDMLVKRGIKCILFDLDNTLIPPFVKEPNKKLQEFIESLKLKIKPILFSNSSSKRVQSFKEIFNIDGYYNVNKNFDKFVEKIMSDNNFKINEVAIIGDELINDVYLGNSIGITTIFVNPVSKKDKFLTKLNRIKEKKILKKLRNNYLFLVGRYYE